MSKYIDKIDAKIIELLQKNGRMHNKEISKHAKISESTVRNRLDRLLKEKIIKIVAVADPFKVGFGLVGNLRIKVDVKMVEHVGNELQKLDEVWYVGQITGDSDFDVEFIVESLDCLNELLVHKIGSIEGIISTRTHFVLRHFKHSYDWGTALG